MNGNITTTDLISSIGKSLYTTIVFGRTELIVSGSGSDYIRITATWLRSKIERRKDFRTMMRKLEEICGHITVEAAQDDSLSDWLIDRGYVDELDTQDILPGGTRFYTRKQ